MSISQRLVDRAYRQRIISEAETRPFRHHEVSFSELKRVDESIRDLKTLMAITTPGHPMVRLVLNRGTINNFGPERLAVQVDGEKVFVVTRKQTLFSKASAQIMTLDRQAVHADARAKYATALTLRNAIADQIAEQDWMITTLRGFANLFSGLLTRTT